MATNNDGHLLDTSGNVAVDFVWGNVPPQPNDVRLVAPAFNAIGGGAGDRGWGTTTDKSSARLDFTQGIHPIIESAYSGFPAYLPGQSVSRVTDASSNGTTVSYTASNTFVPGQQVTITGLTTAAFNLSAVVVATANAAGFTVTNAAVGTACFAQRGHAGDTTSAAALAVKGAYVGGVAFVYVPNVVGQTIALATDALVDSEFIVTPATTTAGSSNTVTNVARTGTLVTITTGTPHGFVAGQTATVTVVTNVAVNGSFVLVSASASTLTYNTVASGTIAAVADTGTVTIPALLGTVKTQVPAAGAASVAIGATVTITSYA